MTDMAPPAFSTPTAEPALVVFRNSEMARRRKAMINVPRVDRSPIDVRSAQRKKHKVRKPHKVR